jgi:hypothetical protein
MCIKGLSDREEFNLISTGMKIFLNFLFEICFEVFVDGETEERLVDRVGPTKKSKIIPQIKHEQIKCLKATPAKATNKISNNVINLPDSKITQKIYGLV